MGKKPIVSVTYENERISIKNSLPNLKCVLRLCCVVHGPIYGRFMGLPLGKQVFFPYKSLYLECHATMPMLADARRCSYLGLGYLCCKRFCKVPVPRIIAEVK